MQWIQEGLPENQRVYLTLTREGPALVHSKPWLMILYAQGMASTARTGEKRSLRRYLVGGDPRQKKRPYEEREPSERPRLLPLAPV